MSVTAAAALDAKQPMFPPCVFGRFLRLPGAWTSFRSAVALLEGSFELVFSYGRLLLLAGEGGRLRAK